MLPQDLLVDVHVSYVGDGHLVESHVERFLEDSPAEFVFT
jgi:hypothetical protein